MIDEEKLEMVPEIPEIEPVPGSIVLGRFSHFIEDTLH